MKSRIVHLKVKVKQLASEAKDIRNEEKKQTGITRRSLHEHRVRDIRPYARLNYLAYGFLRGKSYRQLENSCRKAGIPNWEEVWKLVERFGVVHDFDNNETREEYMQRRHLQNERWDAWHAEAMMAVQ